VAFVKIVKGTGTPTFAPTKPLKFSGYDWDVRTIASDRGGTNNLYDPDNAWTDASGALHLQIKPKSGKWSCAEMVLNRSLGYGTYAVTVRDTSSLEPAAVFSMFTFEDWSGDEHYREMDVEVSRWVTPRARTMHNLLSNHSTFPETCSLSRHLQDCQGAAHAWATEQSFNRV